MTSMTRSEFIAYAHEATSGDALEGLRETIDQHNSEVAGFGDSWPGALVHINTQIKQIKQIEATLARLEGREPRDFHFRVLWPDDRLTQDPTCGLIEVPR